MAALLENLGWIGIPLSFLLPWAALVYPLIWILILLGPIFLYAIYSEIKEGIKNAGNIEESERKNRGVILFILIFLSLPFIFYIL